MTVTLAGEDQIVQFLVLLGRGGYGVHQDVHVKIMAHAGPMMGNVCAHQDGQDLIVEKVS